MTETTSSIASTPTPTATASLRGARTLWFVLTVVGQVTFVYFIVAFYYGTTLRGDFAQWNNKPLITGHVPGDTAGNLMFATHVLMAAIMTLGGVLQLFPQIRARVPALHRWNGRLFLLTAVLLALGGLWMVWIRGTYLNFWAAMAISIDAGLILWFAVMTLRRALAGRFDEHRKWALRTFMAANGVWMLRIGYMFWAVVAQGEGMTKRMDGSFDAFWVYGCYLVPLALLEMYFVASEDSSDGAKYAASAVLVAAAVAIGIGIVGAYAFMWSPYL